MQRIYFSFAFVMTSRRSSGDGHRAGPQRPLAKLGEAASWEEKCRDINITWKEHPVNLMARMFEAAAQTAA